MGCDIHIVVEHQVEMDGDLKWIGLHACPYHTRGYTREDAYIGWEVRSRNYDLFADIAGVRGMSDDYPDAAPRGMPEDASDLAIHHLGDDGDVHSVSWMPMDEAFVKFGKYLANVVTAKMLGSKTFEVDPAQKFTVEDRVRWKMADHFGIDVTDDPDHPRSIDKYHIVFGFDS